MGEAVQENNADDLHPLNAETWVMNTIGNTETVQNNFVFHKLCENIRNPQRYRYMDDSVLHETYDIKSFIMSFHQNSVFQRDNYYKTPRTYNVNSTQIYI